MEFSKELSIVLLTALFCGDIIINCKVAFSTFPCRSYNLNSSKVFLPRLCLDNGKQGYFKMIKGLAYLTLSEQEN